MKIAAKYCWDIVRHLTKEEKIGNRWFLWDENKTGYRPDDFQCFTTREEVLAYAKGNHSVTAMPVAMLLQCLYRKLFMNCYYPFCLQIDIPFLYHLYLKENSITDSNNFFT